MSNTAQRKSIVAMINALGWPLIVGSVASLGFYSLISAGILDFPLVERYFTAHPVSYAATVMFFVGVAALGFKLFDVSRQFTQLNRIRLDEPTVGGRPVSEAERMLDTLDEAPRSERNSYLGGRVRAALDFVARNESADELEDELKYLSDVDSGRQHESYSLVRILVWATPMLGFLGTVIGITQALGDMSTQELGAAGANADSAISGLLSGLYVAFDTTALALTLSIVMMFLMFIVNRIETQLLEIVDVRAMDELIGQFEQLGSSSDPNVASIHRMNQAVIQATEQLVVKQAELWNKTMASAQQQWQQQMSSMGQLLNTSLQDGLNESMKNHAKALSEAESSAQAEFQQRWQDSQKNLESITAAIEKQNQHLTNQAEFISEAVKAVGEVKTLEQTLNENLNSLAGAKNFEDTVMSLSAAIHLLNTRMGGDSGRVSLTSDRTKQSDKGRAA